MKKYIVGLWLSIFICLDIFLVCRAIFSFKNIVAHRQTHTSCYQKVPQNESLDSKIFGSNIHFRYTTEPYKKGLKQKRLLLKTSQSRCPRIDDIVNRH